MLSFLLAAAGADRNPFEPPPLEYQPGRVFGMATKDMLLILGAAGILALVLFLWVYLTRRERRLRTVHSSRPVPRERERDRDRERDEEHRSGRRRRRRRHHHEEFPRNPTLQETGGLPPLRPEEPSGSPPPPK